MVLIIVLWGTLLLSTVTSAPEFTGGDLTSGIDSGLVGKGEVTFSSDVNGISTKSVLTVYGPPTFTPNLHGELVLELKSSVTGLSSDIPAAKLATLNGLLMLSDTPGLTFNPTGVSFSYLASDGSGEEPMGDALVPAYKKSEVDSLLASPNVKAFLDGFSAYDPYELMREYAYWLEPGIVGIDPQIKFSGYNASQRVDIQWMVPADDAGQPLVDFTNPSGPGPDGSTIVIRVPFVCNYVPSAMGVPLYLGFIEALGWSDTDGVKAQYKFRSSDTVVDLIPPDIFTPAPKPSAPTVVTPPPEPEYPPIEGMIFIPGGDLTVYNESGPQKVTIDPFYIDETPVTNGEFVKFILDTGYIPSGFWVQTPKGEWDLPVIKVTLDDAMKYAEWAGKRLPTLFEWEFAAMGTDGREFPWGNQYDASKAAVGNGLEPVGSHPEGASPFGVLDMAGEVWEWTAPLPRDTSNNMILPIQSAVVKGGCYTGNTPFLKSTYRWELTGSTSLITLGFRCAKSIEQ